VVDLTDRKPHGGAVKPGIPQAAFKFSFTWRFRQSGYTLISTFDSSYFGEGSLHLLCGLAFTHHHFTAALIVSGYYIGAFVLDKPFQELYHMDPANYFSLFESGALPSTAASMTLAMSIKLTKNWIQAGRREKLLEKEKLENGMKFLSGTNLIHTSFQHH